MFKAVKPLQLLKYKNYTNIFTEEALLLGQIISRNVVKHVGVCETHCYHYASSVSINTESSTSSISFLQRVYMYTYMSPWIININLTFIQKALKVRIYIYVCIYIIFNTYYTYTLKQFVSDSRRIKYIWPFYAVGT